jgi:RND family efflux transporter MFP subunit
MILRRVTFPLFIAVAFQSALFASDYVEGFTEPYRRVDISVGEPGVIEKITVEPGQKVKQGELIVKLDTSVLDASLAMAKEKAVATGSIDVAAAELQLREGRLKQISQLRERGHATQREYSRALADVDIAKGRLKLAKEESRLNELDCRRIQAQIARRRVSSPVDGIISDVHREVGEALLITDPTIVTLVQLEKLRVRFSVVPELAQSLYPNQSVKVILSKTERVDAVLERIASVVDAKSGTLEVHVVIDNARGKYRSGVRCTMEIEAKANNSALAASR